MTQSETSSSFASTGAKERILVALLCGLAALHVLIFSAAFPLFNNVDEQDHFDLVIKYSHGHVPSGIETVSEESARYISIYGTFEYFQVPVNFPGGHFPLPLWAQPAEKIAPILSYRSATWEKVPNEECDQPPLYYALTSACWRLFQWCGFEDVYWLRFMNCLFVAALVWLGYFTAGKIFPKSRFLRLGVPALIAFMPQTAFYSINNDVLSPLCFGVAFVCLVNLSGNEIPSVRLGTMTGLALAATCLAKMSNLPLLAVAFVAVLWKIWSLMKTQQFRAALPAFVSLFFCAILPIVGWMAWTKYHFGDYTGAAAKMGILGWTPKPFAEWFHHPIFTAQGFWYFARGNLSSFWQGEFLWHGKPLAISAVNWVYVILSIVLIAMALFHLIRSKQLSASQKTALWFGLACLVATFAFLALLSVKYDFHDCFNPSREHPFFISGRLMLGLLIPFMLLFVFGLDCALRKFGDMAKFIALAAMILFMVSCEIATDWTVFSSQYDWFHL